MKKARIVEKTLQNGAKAFVIQQKHWLFRWWWVDAWMNNSNCDWCFLTLEEARKNLCYFDGTKIQSRVVE